MPRLLFDTLRERANQMLHHERAGFATGARLRLSSLRASGLLRAGSDSPARALNRQGE